MDIKYFQYKEALEKLKSKLSKSQRKLLQMLYSKTNHSATAKELAPLLGMKSHEPINGIFGKIGHMVSDELGVLPPVHEKTGRNMWWMIISEGESTKQGFKWTLKAELVQALEDLRIVSQNDFEVKSFSNCDCDMILTELKYDKDIRKRPDNLRKSRFITGWNDAVIKGKQYREEILKSLTWQNLGYRLGNKYGNVSTSEIENIFQLFSEHYLGQYLFPEDFITRDEYKEGNKKTCQTVVYERNPHARKRCIFHYGAVCQICGFDFEETYGAIGKGIIHVHHIKPLHEIEKEYKLDPIEDLIPLCPNCHTVIHRKSPPYKIEEIKDKLEKSKKN